MKEQKLYNWKDIFTKAFRLSKAPIIISFLVTPIRFLLELAGHPDYLIFIIGLLWLTLAVSIYWGIKLFNHTQPYLILLLSLILFSPISRLTVFAAWWVDTKWEIGTHYGLYFNNWEQALLNQVIYGAITQIIPGFIIGALTIVFMRNRKSVKK